MAKYAILFSMLGNVTDIRDGSGKRITHDVTINTPRWGIGVSANDGHFWTDYRYCKHDVSYMEMDFPDDAAAVAWAKGFNARQLDPWRVRKVSHASNGDWDPSMPSSDDKPLYDYLDEME